MVYDNCCTTAQDMKYYNFHSASKPQTQRFTVACEDFGLTICPHKTQVMGQGVGTPPSISIRQYALEAVHKFVYLGSTITDNLSLETELNNRNGLLVRTGTPFKGDANAASFHW